MVLSKEYQFFHLKENGLIESLLWSKPIFDLLFISSFRAYTFLSRDRQDKKGEREPKNGKEGRDFLVNEERAARI